MAKKYAKRVVKVYSVQEYLEHKQLLEGFRADLANAVTAQRITNKAYTVATELGQLAEWTDPEEGDFWGREAVFDVTAQEIKDALKRIKKLQSADDRKDCNHIMGHKVMPWVQGMMVYRPGADTRSITGVSRLMHQRALALQGMLYHAIECASDKDYPLWIAKCLADMREINKDAQWVVNNKPKSYKDQMETLYGEKAEEDDEDDDDIGYVSDGIEDGQLMDS